MQVCHVPLFAFCHATRRWVALSSLPGASSMTASQNNELVSEITCLTYNVYSGTASSDLPHASARTQGAIAVIRRLQADVIALQEVSVGFEKALRRERWLSGDGSDAGAGWVMTSLQDYWRTGLPGSSQSVNQYSSQAIADRANDGCILAIKRSLLPKGSTTAEMLKLPGSQGRVAIFLSLASKLRIATSHFESMSANSSTRVRQYTDMSQRARIEADNPTILLGDFNHSSYTELSTLLGHGSMQGAYVDACQPKRPSSGALSSEALLRHQPTFGELYPFFPGSRERRRGRRLDLILHSPATFELLEAWTDGGQPLRTSQPKRSRKGGQSATNEARPPRNVKLRCTEGKGGHCCEQILPSDQSGAERFMTGIGLPLQMPLIILLLLPNSTSRPCKAVSEAEDAE